MNETWVTVTGHVISDVQRRTAGGGAPLVRFRLAVPERRYDAERAGRHERHTSFYTVWARQELAVNLHESVARGDPLMVRGRLWLRPAEGAGARWQSADLEAVAAGHDLSHGTAAFHRVSRVSRMSRAPRAMPRAVSRPGSGRPFAAGRSSTKPP
jgi:single-strand DNA-binding protein